MKKYMTALCASLLLTFIAKTQTVTVQIQDNVFNIRLLIFENGITMERTIKYKDELQELSALNDRLCGSGYTLISSTAWVKQNTSNTDFRQYIWYKKPE